MAGDPTFQDLMDSALARPREQLVHVFGGLLDLARDDGLRDIGPVRSRVAAAAQARLSNDAGEAPLSVVLYPHAPGAIPALILLAPVVGDDLARYIEALRNVPVQVVVAVIASLTKEARQRLAGLLLARAERTLDPRDQAALLVALAPLLSGEQREKARALFPLWRDRQLRLAVADAFDERLPADVYYQALSPRGRERLGGGLAWWPTLATQQLLSELTESLEQLPSRERRERLHRAVRDALAVLGEQEEERTGRSRVFLDDEPSVSRNLDSSVSQRWDDTIDDFPSEFRRATSSEARRATSSPSLFLEDTLEDLPSKTATTPGPRPQPLAVDERGFARAQRVSLGMAARSAPGEALPAARTLARWRRYYLWVEIGPELVTGSLPGAAALPETPAGSELDVVLFGFPGQLRIEVRRRHGTLQIQARGPARVTRPAATPPDLGALARQRLFFPVRTPWRPGRHAVRCNVYHRGLLLQSHLITVEVTREPDLRAGALQRVTDYTLSATLDTGRLARTEPHRLSILLNDDGAGTHGLRFAGADGFVADAHIDGATLAGLIDYARGALRRVAWGAATPWQSHEQARYRYDTPPSPAQRADDLILLARHGYRLWGEALASFGVRGRQRTRLRELMRETGVVQLALKKSADHIFPAALIYDHPLDTNLEHLTLCQTAAAAMDAGADLEAVPCFAGRCPSHGDKTVVCPSGFWGFRHDLGVPLHLGERGEVAAEIARAFSTLALIGVSTDPAFTERSAHVAALGRLDPQIVIQLVEDRRACLAALESAPPHLAYFFCHGGITAGGTPYLELGARHSEPITADNLLEMWWEEPRPLVVLNGCHTTAASPEQIFSLVTGFVVHANAAGVIGTEITIFEPMAVAFGEELLRRFLGGDPLGRAVRRARLALLRQGNPLGLAYIPFALATLRLTA
jgi:hypothetical protein